MRAATNSREDMPSANGLTGLSVSLLSGKLPFNTLIGLVTSSIYRPVARFTPGVVTRREGEDWG